MFPHSVYVSLHTQEPMEDASYEVSYPRYKRQELTSRMVKRTPNGMFQLLRPLIFPHCGKRVGVPLLITHFSLQLMEDGFKYEMPFGIIRPAVTIRTGDCPVISTATLLEWYDGDD